MPTSYPLADNICAALRAYADLITKHNHALPSVYTFAPPIISSIGFVTVGSPRFDSSLGCPVNEDTTCIQRTPSTLSYMLSYMIPGLPYGAHR